MLPIPEVFFQKGKDLCPHELDADLRDASSGACGVPFRSRQLVGRWELGTV